MSSGPAMMHASEIIISSKEFHYERYHLSTATVTLLHLLPSYGAGPKLVNKIKKELGKLFQLTDLGNMSHFLGCEYTPGCNEKNQRIPRFLHQTKYIHEILKYHQMEDFHAFSTPMESSTVSTLSKKHKEEHPGTADKPYRTAIGQLMYLACKTRPDIAAALGLLSRQVSCPQPHHWKAVKRVLRYLKGAANLGLCMTPTGKPVLFASSDADWAGECDRISVSGFLMTIGNVVVAWGSKKQTAVSLSSTESEYYALSLACQTVTWLRNLCEALGSKQAGPDTVQQDNSGSICWAESGGQFARNKHVSLRYHHTRNLVDQGIVRLLQVPTDDMWADVFTKALGTQKFSKSRNDFLRMLPIQEKSGTVNYLKVEKSKDVTDDTYLITLDDSDICFDYFENYLFEFYSIFWDGKIRGDLEFIQNLPTNRPPTVYSKPLETSVSILRNNSHTPDDAAFPNVKRTERTIIFTQGKIAQVHTEIHACNTTNIINVTIISRDKARTSSRKQRDYFTLTTDPPFTLITKSHITLVMTLKLTLAQSRRNTTDVYKNLDSTRGILSKGASDFFNESVFPSSTGSLTTMARTNRSKKQPVAVNKAMKHNPPLHNALKDLNISTPTLADGSYIATIQCKKSIYLTRFASIFTEGERLEDYGIEAVGFNDFEPRLEQSGFGQLVVNREVETIIPVGNGGFLYPKMLQIAEGSQYPVTTVEGTPVTVALGLQQMRKMNMVKEDYYDSKETKFEKRVVFKDHDHVRVMFKIEKFLDIQYFYAKKIMILSPANTFVHSCYKIDSSLLDLAQIYSRFVRDNKDRELIYTMKHISYASGNRGPSNAPVDNSEIVGMPELENVTRLYPMTEPVENAQDQFTANFPHVPPQTHASLQHEEDFTKQISDALDMMRKDLQEGDNMKSLTPIQTQINDLDKYLE